MKVRRVRLHRSVRPAASLIRTARPWHGVRVLGYHRVSIHNDPLSIHPHAFRRQLEQVAVSRVRVLPLGQALDLLEAGKVGDQRYLCITFDGGYRDLQDEAYLALREFDFPATVFVPTAIIDGTAGFYWYRHPPEALSWTELRELEKGGLVDVQSQTRTHPWLPHLHDEEAHAEIVGSKVDLEKELGHEITVISFPDGVTGRREVAFAEQAGYRAGVSTVAGVNTNGESRFRLRRTMVVRSDSDRLFGLKLAGAFDRPSIRYRLVQLGRRRRSAPGYADAASPT